MARQAAIAPPPRVIAELERAEAPAPTIDKPSADDLKYINFRVSREDFVEVKKAALDEGVTLGVYLMHVHRVYQKNK